MLAASAENIGHLHAGSCGGADNQYSAAPLIRLKAVNEFVQDGCLPTPVRKQGEDQPLSRGVRLQNGIYRMGLMRAERGP
jgi:hypothetical protein